MTIVRSTVVDHPLAAARLSALREASTPSPLFRANLAELATLLIYEATRALPTEQRPIRTPVADTVGTFISTKPVLVPVLRAGLGMAEAGLRLLPEATMGFIGLARDETTHQPTAYMESLPRDLAGRPVLLLDPMLATGGSLIHALRLLVDRGADDITVVCVLAAPEGVAAVEKAGIPIRLFTASIDIKLNENAYIVPGLGDAGDRQFGAT